MVDPINVSPSGGPPYQGRFEVSSEFKQFWHHLFKNAEISEKQMQQMTDQFIKMVWDQMSRVLKWALEQQKERDKNEKEERGG